MEDIWTKETNLVLSDKSRSIFKRKGTSRTSHYIRNYCPILGTAGLTRMLCSMSYMISLICSIPTETLTISGATPRSIFSCGNIGLCVVDQGCMAVVFASP